MRLKLLLKTISVLLAVMFLLPSPALCEETPKKKKCEKAFPNLLGDVCWECMFPVRIGGRIVMDASDMPDNIAEITGNPDDYKPDTFGCKCEVNGVDYPGIYVSFWEPARVTEVRPDPGRFAFLFGMDLTNSVSASYGNKGPAPVAPLEKSFQHVNYYSAPLFELMEIVDLADFCKEYGITGLDLMFSTAIGDPTWNDDALALLLFPETSVFANPIAQAICTVDCLAASAYYPLNALFWCAGCHGSLYPMTGSVLPVSSRITVSSLQSERLMARLARYPIPPAMELDTSSSIAKCGGVIRPLIKKSQYRITTVTPIPETKMYHTFGASSLLWGEHRTIPATGEDHTFIYWRKKNCCLTYLKD